MPRAGSFLERAVFSLTAACLLVLPLAGQGADNSSSIKTGVGVEYLNRTISWDEDAYTSNLSGLLFTFQAEVEVRRGLAVLLQAGYALSDFKGLVFRQLPFSVEYQAGSLGGILVGGGLKGRLALSKSFELEMTAVFDACLGFQDTWTLEGLAVEGTLEGKSTWMRFSAGPVLWYKGLPWYVYPYLQVQFNTLWGSFNMTETVASLEGTEEKKIIREGPVSISLGLLSEVSNAIGLRAEVTAVPRSGGVDIGAAGRLIFSF